MRDALRHVAKGIAHKVRSYKKSDVAVGFRNIAVHSYNAIDWAIVHAIATCHLGDFEDFARLIDQGRR
ncbi:HepT-like ribonuclease domain-containing protein [Rhodanobacter sp. UC4450_H17]